MTGILRLYSGGTEATKSNITFAKYQTGTKILQQGNDIGDFTLTLPGATGTLISDYSLNDSGLRLGWDYLVSINATTTGAAYTLLNSRKFSDYAYILFLCSDGNLTRNPSIIPRSMFDGSSTGTKFNVEIDYGNLQTMRWVSFRHVSDTQVTITGYANNTVTVNVIGAKMKVN